MNISVTILIFTSESSLSEGIYDGSFSESSTKLMVPGESARSIFSCLVFPIKMSETYRSNTNIFNQHNLKMETIKDNEYVKNTS